MTLGTNSAWERSKHKTTSGQKVLELTIHGAPRVKKNGQKVSFRGSYPVKYNTPAYTTWEQSAKLQLRQHRPSKPIDYPVNICFLFYMKTRRKVDLSNLLEGPQDCLVDVGILADDNSTILVGVDGSRVHHDKDNPRVEITISKL